MTLMQRTLRELSPLPCVWCLTHGQAFLHPGQQVLDVLGPGFGVEQRRLHSAGVLLQGQVHLLLPRQRHLWVNQGGESMALNGRALGLQIIFLCLFRGGVFLHVQRMLTFGSFSQSPIVSWVKKVIPFHNGFVSYRKCSVSRRHETGIKMKPSHFLIAWLGCEGPDQNKGQNAWNSSTAPGNTQVLQPLFRAASQLCQRWCHDRWFNWANQKQQLTTSVCCSPCGVTIQTVHRLHCKYTYACSQ